ncbi:M13 family metallopeptidase [Patescibacteria group bacterium]|nr:M13 family metallopeptidase [Patescibacteria group bacterium]
MNAHTKHWGFDNNDLNPKVRPQDDFYQYAAGGWLKRNPIPKHEARWGTFMVLRYDTEKKLKAILTDLLKTRSVKKGSPEQLIRDLYRSGMDLKRRNTLGARPLAPYLKEINAISSKEDLLKVLFSLHRLGVGVLFGAGIDQDSKESTKYIIHLYQDGLGMPDRDYYLKDDAESKRVRSAYVPHVAAMFRLIGKTTKESKLAAATVMRIETMLAEASMTKEDRRDADKVYHKKTLKELQTLAPHVEWKKYFTRLGAGELKSVIVMQPQFLTASTKLIGTLPLEDWKTYLTWHLVSDFAGALSTPFIKQSFSFYGTVLSGMKHMKPLWRQVLSAVNGNLGELLGRIYVKRHFSPIAKKKMNLLVDDLFTAYEARLKKLDWMSPATKKKALIKLRALNRKIGYPDKWKSFAGLVIRPNDYAGNMVRVAEFIHRREMKKLKKPIDRTEWFMYPQTVNAYFAPNMNDIAFPAAILQPPFFDSNADDAINYGAIGSVIGHEITHGFDDQGSKYDEHGNLKSWWTKEDRKRFEKKAQVVIDQFNRYTVSDGVKVNGKLTLGENIADLGGIAIALDAFQLRLKKTGRKDIDGYTPEQRFFLGVTLFDRENTRPAFEKTHALTDPHSPPKFRINGPVSNIDAFYNAFGLKKGDGLYRAPQERAKIW